MLTQCCSSMSEFHDFLRLKIFHCIRLTLLFVTLRALAFSNKFLIFCTQEGSPHLGRPFFPSRISIHLLKGGSEAEQRKMWEWAEMIIQMNKFLDSILRLDT